MPGAMTDTFDHSLPEDELLAETEKTFDLLYEAYFEVPTKA